MKRTAFSNAHQCRFYASVNGLDLQFASVCSVNGILLEPRVGHPFKKYNQRVINITKLDLLTGQIRQTVT